MLLFEALVLQQLFVVFFFNDTATTEIYTLSLHDALPIYVVADGPDLPAVEAFGRDHHGEVGLAAGGGEGGGNVGLFLCSIGADGGFNSEDEHVLGHPALVAGDVGGDAQGKALLAEEGVAAVARAVAPDLAGLGEVDDVLLVVAGPGNILLSRRQRRTDRV